jgi:hypothetical protein
LFHFRDPANKYVADRLIEHDLDGHAAIRARKHGGKRLLLLGRLSTQHLKVERIRRPPAGHIARVTFKKFIQCRLRT